MELTPYSEAGLRPLSRFHAEEMLYEYAQGVLDDKRRIALEEYLKTDEELAEELKRIRRGLKYLANLGDLRVPADSLTKVRSSTNFADRMVEALRVDDWPPGLRLGLESVAVVSIIFVIAVAVPWNSLFQSIQDDSSGLTLAEIRRDFDRGASGEGEFVAGNRSLMDTVKGVVFDDEGVPDNDFQTPEKAADKLAAVPQINPQSDEAKKNFPVKDTVAAVDEAKNAATPKAEKPSAGVAQETAAKSADATTTVAATAPVAVTAEQKRTAASSAESKKDTVATPGFLYRGTLKTTNVEATTPKIVEFLDQAGGRKAGQVPLGWSKDKGSYFHFTIPEAKYGELEAFFREYGTLVITKERHERVMPEGIIRLIIDVDEKTPE